MDIFLASNNPHKLYEFSEILCTEDYPLNFYGAAILGGMPFVDETGSTFAENAVLKANAISDRVPIGSWILADDSGLVVDALEGAPGIRSSRFAGDAATDEQNVEKLLHEIAQKKVEKVTARFVCVLAFIQVEGIQKIFEGTCEGTICSNPSGSLGFGYDPVFVPKGYKETFATLGESVKNGISHRSVATDKLKLFLRETGGLDNQ